MIALSAYALALLLFAAVVGVPFVAKKRDTPAEVPAPPPLRSVDLVNVTPGAELCMTELVVSRETRAMRFSVATYRRPGPPLATSIEAGGYSAATRVRGGYPDNSVVQVPIPPPPTGRTAQVCVKNLGRRKLALYGSGLDPARSRVRTLVNGSYQNFAPTFSFVDGHPSIAGNAGVTAGRIAVFRGFLDHAWIVWLLAAAAVIGVPLLVGVGIVVAERQPRSDSSGSAAE